YSLLFFPSFLTFHSEALNKSLSSGQPSSYAQAELMSSPNKNGQISSVPPADFFQTASFL
ncbi:MAG: hypothetical protein ACYSR4_07760, partial [Planctomycetota bacterium]